MQICLYAVNMLKIIVYDCGWGGELVANYLENELQTVEVIRLIAWRPCPQSLAEMTAFADEIARDLLPYIGEVDLVVLGGYMVAQTLEDLRQRFSEQLFVAVSLNYDQILRVKYAPGAVVVLCHPLLPDLPVCTELQEQLCRSTIIIPDCGGWQELIDRDLMTEEVLRANLEQDFRLAPRDSPPRVPILAKRPDLDTKCALEQRPRCQALLMAIEQFELAAAAAKDDEQVLLKQAAAESRNSLQPDVALILDTHLWGMRAELERVFGWRVRVMDFREKLLHDVCFALKLRGVHGGRAK